MKSLLELRMEKHELTMRQMVTEIHQGKLNIGQAATKFEVNRKTVQHWLDIVEQEAEANSQTQSDTGTPRVAKKRIRPTQEDTNEVKELKRKVHSLQSDLEAANFKAPYYMTLIRVAEEELGIDLEKKSVTKPSASC